MTFCLPGDLLAFLCFTAKVAEERKWNDVLEDTKAESVEVLKVAVG